MTRAQLASSTQEAIAARNRAMQELAIFMPRAVCRGLYAEGCTTRTILVNQSRIESTKGVVNEGKHEADDDHKLASGKILLRIACLKYLGRAPRGLPKTRQICMLSP